MILLIVSIMMAVLLGYGGVWLLNRWGWVRENYQGRYVVWPLGLFLPLLCIPLFFYIIYQWKGIIPGIVYLLFSTSAYLAGVIDDFFGSKEIKGLKGHLAMARKGIITTGFLKILFPLLGILPLVYSLALPRLFLPLLLITGLLGVNVLNLLDLEPGRALKGLILGSLFLFLAGIYPAIVPLGLGLGLFPLDVKEKAMLGDTGVNYLGALVAGLLLLGENLALITGAFFLLSFLQYWGEYHSISCFLHGSSWGRVLDRWGR